MLDARRITPHDVNADSVDKGRCVRGRGREGELVGQKRLRELGLERENECEIRSCEAVWGK